MVEKKAALAVLAIQQASLRSGLDILDVGVVAHVDRCIHAVNNNNNRWEGLEGKAVSSQQPSLLNVPIVRTPSLAYSALVALLIAQCELHAAAAQACRCNVANSCCCTVRPSR
jgi:hypothetical protein